MAAFIHLASTPSDHASRRKLLLAHSVAEFRLLDIDGKDMDLKERHDLETRQPTESEWAVGLSSMRHKMLAETHARIILGGRVDKFMGGMPGIAEEALYSLQAKQPLYVMGGFGGCARDVAEGIGVLEPNGVREWPGRDKFNSFKGKKLNDGLSAEENRVLASTPHVDQAIVLILRGLTKATPGPHGGIVA